MQLNITCPTCGETEDLSGSDSPDGIRITCGACGESWLRDAAPIVCATCGGTEIELRQRALTQYSRGTQLSIVGMTAVPLCRTCDARMLEWANQGRAVPFDYRPAAQDPQAAKEREDETGGDVTITP